jgi:hypothetical protein
MNWRNPFKTLRAKPAYASSIDEDFNNIVAAVCAENAAQTEHITKAYPAGYFKQYSPSGKFLGLRHYCGDCKRLTDNPGKEVQHCGRTDKRPETFLRLLFTPESSKISF